jgi:hypothetical protein
MQGRFHQGRRSRLTCQALPGSRIGKHHGKVFVARIDYQHAVAQSV